MSENEKYMKNNSVKAESESDANGNEGSENMTGETSALAELLAQNDRGGNDAGAEENTSAKESADIKAGENEDGGEISEKRKKNLITAGLMADRIPLRVKFEKTGMLKYISHLDLCRTMQSAMKRAELPVWYTVGFNPRPKMVFALPLSLFIESRCEFMDIKLTENMPFDEVKRRLNSVFTDELRVVDCYQPETKFTEIGWAEYNIVINGQPAEISELEKMFCGPVEIMKRSKSGDKLTDIRPMIKKLDFSESDGKISAKALLRATSSDFLNPEYIIRAVNDNVCKTNEIKDYSIMRTEVYTEDGKIFM